ncbi:MAG: hypothetical protein WA667_24365 [Candidatus Nitrosopolaris sp.]
MNYKMTSIKNHKTATVLVAIAALAGVLVVSTTAIHVALAANDNVTKVLDNKGISVQTDTNEKAQCDTAGGTSPVSTSCGEGSTDTITNSGGQLHK